MSKWDAAPVDLSGKTCFITGANGGIGSTTAEHFSSLGATVLLTDIAKSFSGNCKTQYRPFDLTSNEGFEDCYIWISETKPDILFNNAALFDIGSILEANLKQFDQLFSLNVRAMFSVMQATARSMVANKQKGSIINLASQAGHRGESLVAHYCATKAAVISYTQSAALTLAPHKTRVNAISPGVIDTPMWKTVDALFADAEGKEIGQKKREVGEAVPLGYMGKPSDVARVAVFLASNQSNYITAQTISVDGGNVLR
jgi:D-sorbitol dehydrogenase (acceptor)